MPGEEQSPSSGDNDAKPQDPQSTPSSEQASAGAVDQNVSTPASASSTPGPSVAPKRLDSISRPSSARGRGGAKPVIAPKPKFAARRSQAARQEQEERERAKKEQEAAAAAEEARKKAREDQKFGYGRGRGRGRGARGGRGRGGHMGDSRQQEPVASGPFSSGQVSSDVRRSGWSSGGGGGGGGSGAFGGGSATGGSRSGGYSGGGGVGGGGGGSYGGGASRSYGSTSIKTESGMGDISMNGMSIKREDGGYISSDEEGEKTTGPKQNIDEMQVIDMTGEDTELAVLRALEPVRLTRVPHKEYAAGLNDAEDDIDLESSDNADISTSEKRKGKQKARDLEVTGATERPKRPTAYSSSEEEPHIKEEPMDDDTRPTTPEPQLAPAPRDQTASPEAKRKAKAQIKALVDADLDDFPMPLRPKFQTQAEADEWERKYMDLKQIRDELGQLLPPKPAPAPDANGDTAMAESDDSRRQISLVQEEREQGTYIFQFPPVLPHLHPVNIKADPEAPQPSTDESAMEVDKPAEPVDLTKEIKQEENAKKDDPKARLLPAGSVGKLRIHKSGKATMDWGGTSFVLGMGTDATFLQNILLAKLPEKKVKKEGEEGPSEPEGETRATGLGMGQIRGKFVLTPDLDELLK